MGGSNADVKQRGIAYAALPSQRKFHALQTRFKGFSGPIGSGKSQALCQEAIRLSYLNPGRVGLMGAPTFPMLRDATQATLLEILDSNEIPYDVSKSENVLVLKDTRSRILFRSVEEFERLRGTNLAWFGLDELTYAQEESWLRLEGRLRDPLATKLCGFAVWTPKGFDWVYRKFIAHTIPGYGVIKAKPFENRHLIEKVGNYYEQLKESYDPKFYEQEVLGLYLSMDGSRVFSSFDEKRTPEGFAGGSDAAAVVGVGLQCGSHEFDSGADHRRKGQSTGRDCYPARHDEGGLRGVPQAVRESSGAGVHLWGRVGVSFADYRTFGLRHGDGAVPGVVRA